MWKIKYFWLCVTGLCALLAWYGSAACQKRMEWFADSVSLRWENGAGASPEQMSGAPPCFVLWTCHYEQALYGDLYPAAAKGEVFRYYGDISRLQPCRFRCGYWPGDGKGCVIDEGIAHALWGSADVLGRTVRWNEETWQVCGVIEGMDALALFPAEETEDMPFQGLWLDLEHGGTDAAEQMLRKHRLPMGAMTDLGLYVWLSQIMAAAPSFLLWAWALASIVRRLWKLRHTWLLFLMSVPPMAAAMAVVSRTAGFPWSVPPRFLPTRWSDGSFWSGLWGQARDGILAVFRMPPAAWERTFWAAFLLCGLLSVLAVLFLWAAARRLPAPGPRGILWITLAWWAGLFCIIWKNGDSPAGNPSSALWMLPTVWMAARWLLKLHADWTESGKYWNQGENEHVFIEEKTEI